jgi:hypothetical protein
VKSTYGWLREFGTQVPSGRTAVANLTCKLKKKLIIVEITYVEFQIVRRPFRPNLESQIGDLFEQIFVVASVD